MKRATIRILERRAEAYAAALLPHRDPADIRTELDNLRWKIHEIENESKIDEAEAYGHEKMMESRKRIEAVMARRRRKKNG